MTQQAALGASPLESPFGPLAGTDPALLESQAGQLLSASLTSYGHPINPQLAYESLTSGATPNVLGAIQSGTPAYSAAITGQPAGSSQSPLALSQAQPQQAGPDIYNLDWKSYWSNNQSNLGKDENASWRSFGEIPVANVAYFNGVRNQTDPKRIKQWQQMLQHQGFLDSKAQISGVWDTSTDAAFRAMMISRFTPDALYGKSQNQKDTARLFLAQLGVDTTTLDSIGRRDPSFSKDVATRWMAAQGPDVAVGDKSQLQQFADAYGIENLPQNWQSILHENFFDWLRGGLGSSFFTILGGVVGGVLGGGVGGVLLGAALGGLGGTGAEKLIPGVQQGVNAAVNVLTGEAITNPGDITKSAGQIRAEQISSQMTDAEKQALAPALQQVAQNSGFMGMFDAWDRIRNKAILGVGYSIGDAFSGHGFENPFDPSSAAGRGAAAHQDNLLAGLFGDQWATDHPTLATWGNLAANMLDDPTSYFFPGTKGGRALGKVLDTALGRSPMAFVTPAVRDAVAAALDTSAQRSKELLSTIRGAAQSPNSLGLYDTGKLLGEASNGDLAWERLQHVQSIHQGDLGQAADLLNSEFGHTSKLPSADYNSHAQAQLIGPVMLSRLGRGGVSALRTVGGFGTGDRFLDVQTDPWSVADKFVQAGAAAGMSAQQLRPLLDEFLSAGSKSARYAAAAKFGPAIVDHLRQALGDKYESTVATMQKARSGSSFLHRYSDADQVALHSYVSDADAAKYLRAPLNEEAQLRIGELNKLIAHEQDILDQNRSLVAAKFGPGADEAYRQSADYIQHEQEAKARIETAQREIDGLSRPAPVMPSQLGQGISLPFSTYEIAAMRNPTLLKWEKLQQLVHLDAMGSVWRRAVLAPPSTAMRIVIGDDAIRGIAWQALHGHPLSAAKLAANTIRKGGKALVSQSARDQSQVTLAAQAAGDVRAYLSETDRSAFVPYSPEHFGYAESLGHVIGNMWSKDNMVGEWLSAYTKGGQGAKDSTAALRTLDRWYTSDSPDAAEMRSTYRLQPDSPELDNLVARTHDYLTGLFGHEAVQRWTLDGKVNKDELATLLKDPAHRAQLPTIVARRRSAYSDNVVLRGLTGATDWLWDHVTTPMVQAARSEVLTSQRAIYEKTLRGTYGDTWDEAKVQAMADSMARNWLLTNTYQGARSVVGQALRNVFPFWGATANMDRFWMRQARAPFIGNGILRLGAAAEQNANNQDHMTGLQSLLSKIGFTGGTALQFNPAHMVFITSDGMASMVPGFGPLFAPLFSVIAKDQHLSDVLKDVPGIGEQIGYAQSSSAMFPWLSDVISGAGTAITGQPFSLPIIGRSTDTINQKADDLIRQRESLGQTVTKDDIANIYREVGRGMFLQGGLHFALPISPSIVDERGQQIQQAQTQFDQATTADQKDAVLAQQLGVSLPTWQKAVQDGSYLDLLAQNPQSPANLLAYFDSRFGQDERSRIQTNAPWVQAYGTSKYESADQTPATLQQWQMSRAAGNIHLLTPDEYINRVSTTMNVNNGWLAYDQLKQQRYDFLQQTGLSTSSQQYKDWEAQVYQPSAIALEKQYPDWAQKFGTQTRTDTAGLAEATLPLRTLMTWEVIPQSADKETPQTAMWRYALVLRDDAAAQIAAIKTRTHTQAELDLVMSNLQQQLGSLAQQDPTFATQLSGYSFGKWQDVVNLEASEMTAGAAAA